MSKIRKLFVVKLFIFIVFAFSGQAFAQAERVSPEDRLKIFEEVWSVIDEKYFDAKFNGVDWREVKKRYRPKIEKAENANEFYALLDRMAGELNDSHTRVFSPGARADREAKRSSGGVGIEIGLVENEFVITRVLPRSAAEIKKLKAGMIVRKIDGEDSKKVFEKASEKVGASSSERSRRMRAFSKMLAGSVGKNLHLTLENADGKIFDVDLPRESFSGEADFEAEILPSGIAFLKFGEFTKDTPQKVSEFLKKAVDSKGLILDLRANGGGDGEAGLEIAGYFLERRIPVARLVTRTGKPPIPEIPMLLEAGTDGKQIFAKPLVILISEKTASTSELITNALQEYGRVYVIGSDRSCGCVLGFLGYRKITGGGDMSVSEFGFVTAKNKTLEGLGVVPDKIIPLSIENLRNGADPVRSAAEEYLKQF